MGVVYRLKEKIKDYILKEKKGKPDLSCRKLAVLISNKFQVKISKSSINSVIKQSGLSMPVGRRRKRRRGSIQVDGLGAILLKAADYLIGGSNLITGIIKKEVNFADVTTVKAEALLYRSLFDVSGKPSLRPDFGLWLLIGQRFASSDISSYFNKLEENKELPLEIFGAISKFTQEVRCIKFNLTDKTLLYLDGQLHTIWSTQYVPYGFSATLYNIKSYINKYFWQNSPFVLFMAPGYDMPSKDFFDFISSLDSSERKAYSLCFQGNALKDMETMKIEQAQRKFFIFGLWPWQFGKYRNVKFTGEFKKFYFEALKQDFYVAGVETELLQPITKQKIVLKGAALKSGLNEKIRVVVLSNLPVDKTSPEELVGLYINRWPNLEETFQDLSRKIELFTYTGASQHFFSPDSVTVDKEVSPDINMCFDRYFKILDLFVKWHFLPAGYEAKDFFAIKEYFYSLKARIKKHKDYISVSFQPPPGYPFLKDLEYACRRINESEAILFDGLRFWCNIA